MHHYMTLAELQAKLQEIASQSGSNVDRQVLVEAPDGTYYQLESVELEGNVDLVFKLGEEAPEDTSGDSTDGSTDGSTDTAPGETPVP